MICYARIKYAHGRGIVRLLKDDPSSNIAPRFAFGF